MALRPGAAHRNVHGGAAPGDVRGHGGGACAARGPLRLQLRGNVQKAGDEHAGARAADGGRQGRACQGHGGDGRAPRPVPADLWYERRLFSLRHPSVGVHDARGHRRGQRRGVPQSQAQGHARGLPLHREPRPGRLRHLPNGCEYCYANKRPDIAAKNCRLHDPASPLLLGHLRDTDVLTQASQKSFLAKGSPRKGCPQAERLAGEEG